MADLLKIRGSSLPQWADCSRRTAARLWPELVDRKDNLRETAQSIGSLIGTATHAGIEVMANAMIDGTSWSADDVRDHCDAHLIAGFDHGIIWDQTTPTKDVARAQAFQQAMSARPIVSKIQSIKGVEMHLEAAFSDDVTITGTIDVLSDAAVIDWKTGTQKRGNIAQYGAYALLARAHGYEPQKAIEVYIPRVGKTKPQPDPVLIEYAVGAAESVARATIKDMIARVRAFDSTGDENAFLPNPSSMMCSGDYCPAHGTPFCRAHTVRD